MSKQIPAAWRAPLILLFMVMMLGSLFVSRFMLSLSMMLFVIVCFFHNDWKSHLQSFFSSPLLWGMTLLFLLPLLSGLWSEDKQTWSELVRIKLPLLMLPLAFAGPFRLSPGQWNLLSYAFIVIVTTGTLWSIFHYVEDPAAVNEGYLKAKTMITPLENDHVRFSWLIAVAILLSAWHAVSHFKSRGIIFFSLVIVGLWLIIFIHILAARTGIAALYLAALLSACWLIFRKWKWRPGIVMLMVVMLLPVIGWQVFPTFRNRAKYIKYDFDYFKNASYRPGSNDAVRVISILAGWSLLKDKPLGGEGYGDIRKTSITWYDEHYTGMLPEDKIYPSSQILMYGAGCGWPGVVIFLTVMIIPFFMRIKDRLFWWQINLMVLFSVLFDIGLEVQFGVFIYAFTVLWIWKMNCHGFQAVDKNG